MSHNDASLALNHEHSTEQDGRTYRACTETMTIRALLDGCYEVFSQSGRTSLVNPIENTCTCPDPHHHAPEYGCKHLRRVKLDIACGELPHPDECPTDADLTAREPSQTPSTPTPAPATALADGGQPTEPNETETVRPSLAICQAISDRMRDLEREIDCYRAELHDLQTALSVIEDVTELQPSLDQTDAVPALSHAHTNGEKSE